MSMPWIKLYTEILDDPKLGRMPIGLKWHFVALCLMAGECDAEGYLVNGETPLTEDEIAWRLRDDTIPGSMAVLEEEELLGQDSADGAWYVTNFSKRQGRSQSEKRAMWRERKRRQRQFERDTPTDDDETPEDVTRDNNNSHAGITALEKRREEGEETRSEKEDPAPSGAPAKEPTPHQAMFGALLSVYRWDSQLITEKQRGRLNSEAKRLLKADKMPGEVWAAGEWWWENDWRGQKGSTPTYGQLVETLGKVEEAEGPAELEVYQ